mmetsp:Transcript_2580/g.3422  ORF Transcript_2580/g.3422 Transcript_2580/m.3422 type:complete len:157 (+) Transcript_2580:51-521(+)
MVPSKPVAYFFLVACVTVILSVAISLSITKFVLINNSKSSSSNSITPYPSAALCTCNIPLPSSDSLYLGWADMLKCTSVSGKIRFAPIFHVGVQGNVTYGSQNCNFVINPTTRTVVSTYCPAGAGFDLTGIDCFTVGTSYDNITKIDSLAKYYLTT